jgi:hypothetical protein
MMPSPPTVTLQVPYAANEQQFPLQAAQIAVKAFRRLSEHLSDDFDEGSSTSTDQVIAVSPHFLEPLPHRTLEFDS